MAFTTKIPKKWRPYFYHEINECHRELNRKNFQKPWNHLVRAYVIGQAYPLEHSLAHWEMLRFGIKIKSHKEILGQIPRLLVGGIKSFVGKIPVGNNGVSNVPALQELPIPDDILKIFRKAGVKKTFEETV